MKIFENFADLSRPERLRQRRLFFTPHLHVRLQIFSYVRLCRACKTSRRAGLAEDSRSLFLLVGNAHRVRVLEKVLSCEIGFQDLEKVLNLSKMCMKY